MQEVHREVRKRERKEEEPVQGVLVGKCGALGKQDSVPTVTKAPPTEVALFMEVRGGHMHQAHALALKHSSQEVAGVTFSRLIGQN